MAMPVMAVSREMVVESWVVYLSMTRREKMGLKNMGVRPAMEKRPIVRVL